MIPEAERAFAVDALDSMHDTAYRPWRPEAAAHYSRLASAMDRNRKDPISLDEGDASRIVFAVRSFGEESSARGALLDRLREAFELADGALSLDDLESLAGKPVFIPGLDSWALVDLRSESRNHDPLPWLKGIGFEIDPVARGTLCVKADPYA